MRIYTSIRRLQTPEGAAPQLGADLGTTRTIENAAIVADAGRVMAVGEEAALRRDYPEAIEVPLNARLVTPALVDCHTHPAFVRSRADEFDKRLNGVSYEEIMNQGGGIMSSVRALREASDEDLTTQTARNLQRLKAHGVGFIEGKSGYGLSVEAEIRSLRAIKAAAERVGIEVTTTCLAAHVVPTECKSNRGAYLDQVLNEIMPCVAKENLAEAVDVFIENGAFGPDEGRQVLRRARELGLAAHVHSDQLNRGEGTRVAIEEGALSADHLECVDFETISAMGAAGVCAVLLPGSTYCLKMDQWAPARSIIDTGVPVALATDFNPGTSPICNPAFIMSLACLKLGMTPAEAFCAFTINAAYALRRHSDYGWLGEGSRITVALWDCEDLRELPYYAGSNMCSGVISG